jgi:hypothetical protein
MATDTFESMKVHWCPTVASLAAPTVANITAGTDLTPFTPVSGVNIAATQNRASLAMLGQAFITEGMGTHSKSVTMTFTRHKTAAADLAWVLFTYKLAGHLVVGRFGALIAAARAEVYQVECGEPGMAPSAENEIQTFTVEMAVQAYNQNAIIAA